MIKSRIVLVGVLAALLIVSTAGGRVSSAAASTNSQSSCERYVSPSGSDSNSGSVSSPWASLAHAAAAAPDQGCTIWVRSGTYDGTIEIERRFSLPTTFIAVRPYKTILEGNGIVLKVNGARNVAFVGFEIRHKSPSAQSVVVYVDQGNGKWARDISFRDNIIHDSYDNDLLKLNNGVHFAVIEGNIFYNQGSGEEQMDVNGVTDVVIQDNIFFHSWANSGRPAVEAKHFIVVKDSGGTIPGSRRVQIRRNIFLNWEGGPETFVQIGADGKPYFEAQDIDIVNNLMVGNTSVRATAALGIAGAKDVSFVNNTVVGDLPSGAYALRVDQKDRNPANIGIAMFNNIWSDPTGTMDDFSDGQQVAGFVLDNNLYWNGGSPIPDGDVVSPLKDDVRRRVAKPRLGSHGGLLVPFWTGSEFLSGTDTVREEFIRLVNLYATIPEGSPAVGRADPALAPSTDILGHSRGNFPDLGAYELMGVSGTFVDDDGHLFEQAIEWLADEGVTKGCNPPVNDRFCPDDFVTRGQMAAFLVRALGLLEDGGGDLFVDDDASVFEPAIDKLGAAGVTKGCNPPVNDRFCPDDFVTRGQMAAFLKRSLSN